MRNDVGVEEYVWLVATAQIDNASREISYTLLLLARTPRDGTKVGVLGSIVFDSEGAPQFRFCESFKQIDARTAAVNPIGKEEISMFCVATVTGLQTCGRTFCAEFTEDIEAAIEECPAILGGILSAVKQHKETQEMLWLSY